MVSIIVHMLSLKYVGPKVDQQKRLPDAILSSIVVLETQQIVSKLVLESYKSTKIL